MITTKLRGIVLAALLALCCTARADYVAPDIHHATYGEVNVVVPVTSDDPAMWIFRLRNINSGFKVTNGMGGVMHAKVVLYGSGVKMLIQPVEPKLKEAIDAMRSAGVQFNVCNFSLKGMNLDWHELYGLSEADVVPSGFAEVSWLGSHGWVVNPAN